MADITTKRIYDDPSDSDGYRLLVDKLWPRGVKKEDAQLDDWNKEIAPSTELRKWFDHDSEKFQEFVERYKSELKDNKDELRHIVELAKKQKITLLYAASDTEHNNAIVLAEVLNEMH